MSNETTFFNNRVVLITGGTGSFGHALVAKLTSRYQPKKVIVFSRDEMKQWEMQKLYPNDNRVRFFIGDVRDRDRLYRAFGGVDTVIHAAATKIVPTAEYNPFECIKTNINGAMNVVDAAIDNGVKDVVALSTDKASSPINLYGASKLASDKIFVSANVYSPAANSTKFSVVRYGNVMGSRGSVIPFFLSLSSGAKLPITDLKMTRFMISLDQGIELVEHALNTMKGGEIFVKKIPSMKILDIAAATRPDLEYEIVGIRPGEKLHEQMIAVEEARETFDCGQHYAIVPEMLKAHSWYQKNFQTVPEGFHYSSNTNENWMKQDDLALFISQNREKFL